MQESEEQLYDILGENSKPAVSHRLPVRVRIKSQAQKWAPHSLGKIIP